MKKLFVLFVLLCSLNIGVIAQDATMPTIMVFPDDVWMKTNNYVIEVESDGIKHSIPKYGEMFEKERDMCDIIQCVQHFFSEIGFPCVDLKSYIETIKENEAVSIFDEMDIRIDIDYTVKNVGPRKDVRLKLTAIEYSNSELVASCIYDVNLTADPLSLALRKAFASQSHDFYNQIMRYYSDMRENGRKITVSISSGFVDVDFLNDEVGATGDTYSDYFYNLIRKNSLNKYVSKGRQDSKHCEYVKVRIPYFGENGEVLELNKWARNIMKTFKMDAGMRIKRTDGYGKWKLRLLLDDL